MSPAPTFETLADLQKWLPTLTPGELIELGSAHFGPAIAAQVFTVLPGSDPLQLCVISAATAPGCLLTGSAAVAGESGCTVRLGFTAEADNPLLVTIEFDLPAGFLWKPVPEFDFGFGRLTATITPDADVGAANFAFAGDLLVDGEPALAAQLTLPALPEADWSLSVSGTTAPSQKLLTALARGTDPLAVIGNGFALPHFTLSQFRMAFGAGGVSMFAIALAYHANWQPFGSDLFEVTGFEFDFNGHRPFDAESFEAIATAQTKIDDVPIDVSVKFPEAAIFAYLDAGASLSVVKVFSGFRITLPAGFPDIEISTLSFAIFALDQAIDFTLGIDKPIAITDSIHFDRFHFDLGIAYQNGTCTGHGDLFAQFSFGSGAHPTLFALQGAYDSSGSFTLAGAVTDLPIGQVIEALVAQFGVDRSKIPGAIERLTLDTLTLTFARANGVDSFNFLCNGHTTVAGVKVEFAPFLSVTYDEQSRLWQLDCGGTLDLIERDGGKIEFKVELVKSSSDTALTASYTSTVPLTFARLAAIFDLALDGVPSDLDLDLTGLAVSYDFTVGDLVIGAQSANPHYGTAVFLSQAPQGGGPRQLLFLLKTGIELGLSELPLVGPALAKIGRLALTDLAAAIASPAPVPQGAVAALNQAIGRLGAQYPTLPAQGLSGRLLLAATLELGGTPPQPISISLLAPSARPAPAAAATAAAAATTDDGTHWFQVQKSFGPVSIQKLGLRYADNKLWALMNADLNAGPVEFSLFGLGIGSPLTTFVPGFTVEGVALTVDAGPARFSGALIGQIDPINLYGALSLTLPGFSIGALGGYADYQGHPSCFLYAVLDAPLGGPSFFFVTGLAAGFGFNRSLVIPPVGQLDRFPLIAWATGSGPSSSAGSDVGTQVRNAMTELAQNGVIAPAIGEYWIAAGVQFTSFKLLDTFALLTLKLGDQVEIDLLGLSTLSLPPEDPEPIAVAQLALDASFAPAAQEISVMGQLTAASFLLSKSCHLTGGFAFAMWYGGPHAGDFVVSLGGYSPRFDKPAHYPALPRLGLNWQVDDNLSLSGDLYFALTPSAVMAGGGLRAVWASGAIRAWFSVEADFLLLFNPVHYYISASFELGASVKIDLWFTSFTLSIHLGVEAQMWGPRFSGEIEVDLDIVSFTIGFGGGSATPPKPLDWHSFVGKVLPDRPPAGQRRPARLAHAALEAASDPAPAMVQINAPKGILKNLPPVAGALLPLDWLVDGETLAITVTSTVPLKGHQFCDDGNLTLAADPDDHGQPNLAFGVGPADLAPSELTSCLSLSAGACAAEGATLYATGILSSVPKAVWEQRTLDGNGVPVGVDPMQGTTIDNVLTGYTLRPQSPPAQASIEIPLRNLAFTDDGPPIPVAWSEPLLPAADPFAGQSVHDTIGAQLATANRATLIAALNEAGFELATCVDVSSLAAAGSGALLATPTLRYLGEAR